MPVIPFRLNLSRLASENWISSFALSIETLLSLGWRTEDVLGRDVQVCLGNTWGKFMSEVEKIFKGKQEKLLKR